MSAPGYELIRNGTIAELNRSTGLPPPRPDSYGVSGATCAQVLMGLALHADIERLTCHPSQVTLARELGMSRNAVQDALTVLQELGHITPLRKVRRGVTEWLITAAVAVDSPVDNPSPAAVPAAVPAAARQHKQEQEQEQGGKRARKGSPLASVPTPTTNEEPPRTYEELDAGCDDHGWNNTPEPCRGCQAAKARRATDEPEWRRTRSAWEARIQAERTAQERRAHEAARRTATPPERIRDILTGHA